ncbi:phosphotransferase, partial [Streptomyces albidoflavus]
LSGVIDFGCLGAGDPACDLFPAWNLLPAEARPAGHPGAGPDPAGAPGRSPVRALPDAGLRQAPRGDRPLMTRNVAVTVAALAWIATIAVLTARL